MDAIARLYGFAPPSQAATLEQAQRGQLVGDTYLPQGTTTRSVGDGWYEVHFNGQRIGTLRPGGANGQFINDTGADIEGLKTLAADNVAAAAPAASPDMSGFFASPDYQFNLQQGNQAIDRSLAARGRALSGAGVKEGQRFASGLASAEYGNYVNRLFTAAGLGNSATNSTAAAGQAAANNNSAALLGAANTRASSYMAQGEGINNAIQGGISNYLTMRYLNQNSGGNPYGARGPYVYGMNGGYNGGGFRIG
jgi:hypothetical protein